MRVRHSIIRRLTIISAAKRGDCHHHHVGCATCYTRACKSFIIVSIHFLSVALGVGARHVKHVYEEGLLSGYVRLRTCITFAAPHGHSRVVVWALRVRRQPPVHNCQTKRSVDSSGHCVSVVDIYPPMAVQTRYLITLLPRAERGPTLLL